MKKASEVFKSIRFAKTEPRGKAHSSTDDEGHYTVGEKEYNQQLKHVKKMAMQEEKKDKYDEGEYDQEGDMAKSDLRSIIANAQKLHDMIDDADNLPEWCQNKITLAEDYISTVANYMTAEMNESVNKVDVPAYLRKQKGEKPLTMADVKAPRKDSISHPANLAKARLGESGGDVVYKKGDDHIEKYGEDSFALYKDGKKQKYYTSVEAAKDAMKEEVEHLEEKNEPTNPELWSRAKSLARSKFDVYPSAYANGWAAKWYKSKGGGWKSVSEAKEQLPFDPDPPKKKPSVVAGKYGAGYSTARHLARMAMQKQSEKMKKPIKEEEMSKKAQIVKSVAKKKKESAETFQKDPIISKTEVKM